MAERDSSRRRRASEQAALTSAGPQSGIIVSRTNLVEGAETHLETSSGLVKDAALDQLIELLSRPTQALSTEVIIDSIRKRQEAVDEFLLRGGAETLRRLFERIRQLESRGPIKIDLSTLAIQGRILGGLYLPGANLEKLIFTDSDITGSNLYAANLTEAIATDAIMRGVTAQSTNWTNALISGADLSGGRFNGAKFVNTVMTEVKIDEHTNFAGAKFVGTYLGGTDLSIANLAGAVFKGVRR